MKLMSKMAMANPCLKHNKNSSIKPILFQQPHGNEDLESQQMELKKFKKKRPTRCSRARDQCHR